MTWTLLDLVDLIGTIAFAVSGASVGIDHGMDLLGVNVLAVTTACGGGLLRDIIIGNIPPRMFQNPFYVGVAVLVANAVFIPMYLHQKMPKKLAPVWVAGLFLFDTVGLAAFTVDGVLMGISTGYSDNLFLLVILGFMTGVGGGVLRDVMARRIPDIFRKHVYALASICGGICMVVMLHLSCPQTLSMAVSFAMVILLRFLAAYFRWNLPKVNSDTT